MPLDKTLLERLKQNDPSLVKLVLAYQDPKLTASDIQTLAEALLFNTYLKTLDVSDNEIGAEGAKVLAQNSTLTTLNVWCNQIGNEGAKALAQNTTLTTLNMNDNQIRAEGAKALAQNSTLSTLYVSCNQIGDEGAKALEQNSTLTKLDISINQIGVEGAKALAQMSTLTTLHVGNNKIDDEGAKALAQISTLTTLDMQSNQIGIEGAKALAQNSALTTLDVRYNNISDQWQQSLQQQIEANRQQIKQYRNAFWLTIYVLLRQGPSASLFPREIWQSIGQFLNFPSLTTRTRSGTEAVNFMAKHLEEFNERLRNQESVKLIEVIKPALGQARFCFLTSRAMERSSTSTTLQEVNDNSQKKQLLMT